MVLRDRAEVVERLERGRLADPGHAGVSGQEERRRRVGPRVREARVGILGAGERLDREHADLPAVRGARQPVGHVARHALLARQHEPDAGAGQRLGHRAAGEEEDLLDALDLEDRGERIGGVHGGTSWDVGGAMLDRQTTLPETAAVRRAGRPSGVPTRACGSWPRGRPARFVPRGRPAPIRRAGVHRDPPRYDASMTTSTQGTADAAAPTRPEPHPIYLAGRWVESTTRLDVADPARPGELAGSTYLAEEAQLEEAIAAAAAAFEHTRALPAYERGAALRGISAGIAARRDELALLISRESGKPIRDAAAEVDRATLTFRLGAEEAERLVGETIPLDLNPAGRGRIGVTRRFPVGPVAGISPFNFPLNLAAHKVAPAIAAGCPIVLKPPTRDPLTMLTVAEIIHEAGLPAGAVSVLPMSRHLGDRLVSDERFKLLTFTGSPAVGWRMKERAGKKKVVLELGGNAGAIVDASADLDWAVRRCLVGAFAYSGQVCISVQRLLVHESIWDAFMERFLAGAAALRMGDPTDPATDLGPMVEPEAAARTERWVREAEADGARVLVGGRADGAWFPPTVIVDAPRSSQVCSEEAFAPVVVAFPFSDVRGGAGRGQRQPLRAPVRGLHERPGPCLARLRDARGRRRHRQRRAHVPGRPHALRRRQGLGPRSRGPALGDRGHDRAPIMVVAAPV